METDLEYFERRLSEEQMLAKAAQRTDVRAVHNKLAELYLGRLTKLKEAKPPMHQAAQGPHFLHDMDQ